MVYRNAEKLKKKSIGAEKEEKIQMRIHYTSETNKTLKAKCMATQKVLVHYRYKYPPKMTFNIIVKKADIHS